MKTGKRQKRINRFLAQFDSLSAEQLDTTKLEPVFIGQLKRGYRTKSNDECHCGSGKKFKHCHKDFEKMTPRWNHADGEVNVYNPYEKRWVTVLDMDNYIKQHNL